MPDPSQSPKGESEHPVTVNAPAVHVPVAVAPLMDALAPLQGNLAIDATLGLAGHSLALLERIAPAGRLIGIDRDPQMAERARTRLSREAPAGAKWEVRVGNAADLPALLAKDPAAHDFLRGFDLFLADCGLCSVHYDEAARGFSFLREGPLSMKLDPDADGPDAEDLINEAPGEFLFELFRVLGEEPLAGRLVRAIEKGRAEARISTTLQLAELIEAAYPMAKRRKMRIHPATRAFQGLRIFINDELGSLASLLRHSLEGLKVGGRAAYIGFHSLEIRLIKQALRAAAAPYYLSAEDERRGRGVKALKLHKKFKPGEDEIAANPRARSAILRSCTKVSPLSSNISWPQPPKINRRGW